MIKKDRNALYCDMVETYHIIDVDSLPVEKYAVLASGLRPESRIKQLMSDCRQPLDTMLLSAILDVLTWLKWAKTEDGLKNINHPKSVYAVITGQHDPTVNERRTFSSPEEFERELEKRRKGA